MNPDMMVQFSSINFLKLQIIMSFLFTDGKDGNELQPSFFKLILRLYIGK